MRYTSILRLAGWSGAIFLGALILASCRPAAESPAPASTAVSAELWAVSDLQIRYTESSETAQVVVEGVLLDSCTEIRQATVEEKGKAFEINLQVERNRGEDCGTSPVPFSEVVSIPVSSLPPDVYTVSAGGKEAVFTVPSGQRYVVAVDSQPLQQPPPTETAPTETEPSPDATPTVEPTPVPTESESQDTGQTPEETTPPETEPVAPTETPIASEQACREKAAFYGDVTIPDKTPFRQGDTFVKTWRVRNDGTCTWNERYSLIFSHGNQMNGPVSQPMPGADPGDTIEISIPLTAPTGGGEHTGNWQFQDPQGNRFGLGITGNDYIWVQIVVSYIPDPSEGTGRGGGEEQGGSGAAQTGCAATQDNGFESQVLSLINQARASNGLPALQRNQALSSAAYVHSRDMACRDFVDHIGSDGSRWYQRITAQGYGYTKASENIYVGNPQFGGDPNGAYTWWMNSQIHRDNILNTEMKEVGIGYAYSPDSSYGGYYTVVFAIPQ